MCVKKAPILAIASLLWLGACAALNHGNSTKIYANNCQNPREKIALKPNGTGDYYYKGVKSSPLTWKNKGSYIEISQKKSKAGLIAHYDKDGNLILQSFLDARKAEHFPARERIRYRCR